MPTIFATSLVDDLRSAKRDVCHDPRSRVGRDLGLCCRADFIRAFRLPSLSYCRSGADSTQLFWSIFLLCLGRHPSQNPHHFTPDIGQVPRAVVDKLPLVIYIPPPPDQPPKPVTFPSELHTYPPNSPTARRFLFLPFRRRGASTGETVKSATSKKEKGGSNRLPTWEDNWVKGEYPFVQLDSHRASCAICLLDFQEPKRVDSGPLGSETTKSEAENQAPNMPGALQEGEGDITEQAAAPASPSSDLALRLQDAGEGSQPLRLLKCGHVFHVSPSS